MHLPANNTPPSAPHPYAESLALFSRAAEVIPGGIYGQSAPGGVLPAASPYYAAKAQGAHYWCVDGRKYTDYMCGYGPIVLGHGNAEVEEAAAQQRAKGTCFNHPTEKMVELAERLTNLVDMASWAVFGKNGSDMTTWALQLAREHTGRTKILMLQGAYHGIDAWCTRGKGGLIKEDTKHIHTFKWNDIDDFNRVFKKYKKHIAGVFVTPYHHPVFADSELPAPGFLQHVEQTCNKNGSLLVCDDIRAGFRMDMGGSHKALGFEPDIVCFCKALANGYPISATVGREGLRKSAQRVFIAGSYWNDGIAQTAALKTLEILERDALIPQMEALGTQLQKGLEAVSRRWNNPALYIKASGPPAIPYFRFLNEHNFERWQHFCAKLMLKGHFIHPHHNGFISAAHTAADINATIEAADAVLGQMHSQG